MASISVAAIVLVLVIVSKDTIIPPIRTTPLPNPTPPPPDPTIPPPPPSDRVETVVQSIMEADPMMLTDKYAAVIVSVRNENVWIGHVAYQLNKEVTVYGCNDHVHWKMTSQALKAEGPTGWRMVVIQSVTFAEYLDMKKLPAGRSIAVETELQKIGFKLALLTSRHDTLAPGDRVSFYKVTE